MNIEITAVDKNHKSVLRHLLEFYCYDFSEYIQTDVNVHGIFEYSNVDIYWNEDGRHPFFILVNGNYAGFALINRDFKILDNPDGHVMSEFFIMRKYRRQGVGNLAAMRIFDLFPGSWEVSQVTSNPVAVKFWDSVVSEYTQNEFTREILEKDGVKKQVLLFETPNQ